MTTSLTLLLRVTYSSLSMTHVDAPDDRTVGDVHEHKEMEG
jgi:hypothetical protein